MNFLGDLFGGSKFIIILKLIARQTGGGLFTGFKTFFLNSIKKFGGIIFFS